jgi:type II secretory pathway pseudopilin PulG
MSLTTCPECNQPVSSKAYNCPGCGYPLNKQKKTGLWWGLGCLLAIPALFVVISIIGLLAAIGIPSFQKARSASIEKSCQNNQRIIEAAKEQYALTEAGKEKRDENKPMSALEKTAHDIVFPYLRFTNADISDAVGFLLAKSKELDPSGKGINIIYLTTNKPSDVPRLTMNHEKITLYDIIKDIADIADLEVEYRENNVTLIHAVKNRHFEPNN